MERNRLDWVVGRRREGGGERGDLRDPGLRAWEYDV